MANVATVTYKLDPAHFAILQAKAAALGKSMSELSREAAIAHLKLDEAVTRLAELVNDADGNPPASP